MRIWGIAFVANGGGVWRGENFECQDSANQFMGGMIRGISMALLEEAVYDARLGRIVSNNLADYHIPVNTDVAGVRRSG
ncbi:MAG: xanthine dehydrogenase YagR molybdenum-binding subunit [Bryobacterales bacterium]|jgi:xanthine dehydrogenase YagR molybdenum-binding subunit|nr:xanthine dehydrogenase YagR molybdenum-binding subunit [Bryobacterales bacterium]